MNRMSEEFSHNIKAEASDQYEDWTDDQRMEEFAHTGNSECLTPEVAEMMGGQLDGNGEFVLKDNGEIETGNLFAESRKEGAGLFSSYEYLHDLLKKQGWDGILLHLETDEIKGVDVLQKLVRSYGDYDSLPDSVLEELLSQPMNAFAYAILDRVKEQRERAEELISNSDPDHLAFLLNEAGVEFRDVQVLDKLLTDAFEDFPELRTSVIEQQAAWNDQMWGNYDGEIFSQEVSKLNQLPDADLLNQLYLAYKLEVLEKYAGVIDAEESELTSELSGSAQYELFSQIMPSIPDLQKLFADALQHNPDLYTEFYAAVGSIQSDSYYNASYETADAAYPELMAAASRKHPDNFELQLMYVNNSFITPLSSDIFLLNGPEGEFVDIITDIDDWEDGTREEYMPVKIATHLLSQIVSDNSITRLGVASALSSNWQHFPENIRQKAESLGFRPVEDSQKMIDYRMITDMVTKAGLVEVLPDDFLSSVADYLRRSVEEPYFEYLGHSDTDVDLIMLKIKHEQLLQHISPALLKKIEDMIGIKLADLQSVNELIALFDYLSEAFDVEPLKSIDSVMEGASDEKERLYRLKTFLVNPYDKDAIENVMVFAAMIEPDTANEMFAAYAESIDAGRHLSDDFKEYAADLAKTAPVNESVVVRAEESAELLSGIEEGLLRRAGHLFRAGKEMALWEYPGEEQTLDLIQAYKGVARMQDMLARIGAAEGLSITREESREGSKNPLHDIGAETFFFNIEDKTSGEMLDFKVTIRPQANEQGEARINFELYLDKLPEDDPLRTAFMQTIEFAATPGRSRARTVTNSVIRFGFDLDTNTNPPTFSFDMGRNAHTSGSMRRTGDVLGNILSYSAYEGHHMTDFDERFSDPEVFKRLANEFKRYFRNVPLTGSQVEAGSDRAVE